jgi:hypothetical protein
VEEDDTTVDEAEAEDGADEGIEEDDPAADAVDEDGVEDEADEGTEEVDAAIVEDCELDDGVFESVPQVAVSSLVSLKKSPVLVSIITSNLVGATRELLSAKEPV